MFVFTILVFSITDHDESPHLTLLVLQPSLIVIAGALAHLRLASLSNKMIALIASMFLAALIYLLPIFDGMSGSWLSFGVVLVMLVKIWLFLGALILLPGLWGCLRNARKRLGCQFQWAACSRTLMHPSRFSASPIQSTPHWSSWRSLHAYKQTWPDWVRSP